MDHVVFFECQSSCAHVHWGEGVTVPYCNNCNNCNNFLPQMFWLQTSPLGGHFDIIGYMTFLLKLQELGTKEEVMKPFGVIGNGMEISSSDWLQNSSLC